MSLTRQKILFYGASGHGKVVADIVRAQGAQEVAGFLDDDPRKAGAIYAGLRVAGGLERIAALRAVGVTGFIVTIGENRIRERKYEELLAQGLVPVTAIHPAATVSPDVLIGPGSVVMAGAIVNSGTSVGTNAILNTGCRIDHDCNLGTSVHVSPGASLAGGVRVGARSHIGVGACFIQNITVGSDAVVGAGAVVIADVADSTTVVGNPARPLCNADGEKPEGRG